MPNIPKDVTTETEIKIKVKTTDMNLVNEMVKNIIKKLSLAELDLISECKVTQVLMDVEVNYDEFEKTRQE